MTTSTSPAKAWTRLLGTSLGDYAQALTSNTQWKASRTRLLSQEIQRIATLLCSSANAAS